MYTHPLNIKSAQQYLPHIAMVGIGIGTTNYLLHGQFNWLQWVVLSLSTSYIVGFMLLWIAANGDIIKQYFTENWKLYLLLVICFLGVGTLATEVESLIKNLLFLNNGYTPFSSINILFSNIVLSIVLGFCFFTNKEFTTPQSKTSITVEKTTLLPKDKIPLGETITILPIKKGEKIQLIKTEDIVYFEAYDNYAHLYLSDGQKMLCDYSLLFLEKRLDKNFQRIHRKYIVNTTAIKTIQPYLNGRFLIEFDHSKLEAISSSKGYLKTMKKLIKL